MIKQARLGIGIGMAGRGKDKRFNIDCIKYTNTAGKFRRALNAKTQ
jgi:hypothetical protein